MQNDNLLRQKRLGQKLTIDEVARRTKIPRPYVEMIDQGRLDELPPGIYGRSYVRAVAAAIGVRPEEALACCEARLVDVPDPLPLLREIAREQTAPTLAGAIADRVREWYSARETTQPLRLPGTLYVAAGLDALLLFVINAFVVAVAANACRVPVEVLLRTAAWAMIVVCGFTSLMYFLLLAGVGGQTLGMRICGARMRAATGPLDLRAISMRAAEAALGGSSMLVDWLRTSEWPTRRESHV